MPAVEFLVVVSVIAISMAVPSVMKWLAQREEERKGTALADVAQAAGLTAIEHRGGVLEARAGRLSVSIRRYGSAEAEGTIVEVSAEPLGPGLVLRPEGGSLLRRRNPKEVEVGDSHFDQIVSVQGPPALALALLDSDVRRAVASMVSGRLELRGHRALWCTGSLADSVLRFDVPDRVPHLRSNPNDSESPQAGSVYLDGQSTLPLVLRAAVDLGGRLLAPRKLAERLASNLKTEPEAGVRRRALTALLQEFPDAEATQAAVRALLDDPDAEVRLQAAMAVGENGRPVLRALANGEGAEDATTARAVAALATSLQLAEAQDLLRSALRTRRLLTAKACVSLLGRLGGPEASQTLAKVLLVEKHELGEAAAQALAATADPAAEAPLLRALAEGPSEVKRAAAAALGQIGTRDAVLPLRTAERDGALRSSARQAIAEIHARLAGAEQGQLSLAEGEAGRLSLAEGEAGRLSFPVDRAFRRS